jgi:hypothetical protein
VEKMLEKLRDWVRAEIKAALLRYHGEFHAASPDLGVKIATVQAEADGLHAELAADADDSDPPTRDGTHGETPAIGAEKA